MAETLWLRSGMSAFQPRARHGARVQDQINCDTGFRSAKKALCSLNRTEKENSSGAGENIIKMQDYQMKTMYFIHGKNVAKEKLGGGWFY